LEKFKKHGVGGMLLAVMRNWLQNRRQNEHALMNTFIRQKVTERLKTNETK